MAKKPTCPTVENLIHLINLIKFKLSVIRILESKGTNVNIEGFEKFSAVLNSSFTMNKLLLAKWNDYLQQEDLKIFEELYDYNMGLNKTIKDMRA